MDLKNHTGGIIKSNRIYNHTDKMFVIIGIRGAGVAAITFTSFYYNATWSNGFNPNVNANDVNLTLTCCDLELFINMILLI